MQLCVGQRVCRTIHDSQSFTVRALSMLQHFEYIERWAGEADHTGAGRSAHEVCNTKRDALKMVQRMFCLQMTSVLFMHSLRCGAHRVHCDAHLEFKRLSRGTVGVRDKSVQEQLLPRIVNSHYVDGDTAATASFGRVRRHR